MERQTKLLTTKESLQNKKWYVVDAENKPLGRLATQIAILLMGKDQPSYTPNTDCGANVIVLNCDKVYITGKNKLVNKTYYNVSGYTGGLRKRSLKVMIKDYPEEMFTRVVKNMLPKTRLGRKMIKHLHVYKDATHQHQGQNPIAVELVKKVEDGNN